MSKFFLVLAVSFLVPTVHAEPSESQGIFDITSVEIHEVTEDVPPTIQVESDCTLSPFDAPDLGTPDVDIGQIITIGEKVWQIIQDNKPVVNVKTAVASALPRGVTCWTDLENWQPPKTQSYEVTYKNYFGMEVVKFRFRLQYTYGGTYDGKGKFLSSVTVIPAELNVLWGYTFNADVELSPAVNLGSKTDPLAGLELDLKWSVNTVMKASQNSFHFFVQGDGALQAQN